MLRPSRIATLLALAGLLVTGCGGDDPDPVAQAQTQARKAEKITYRSKAASVCDAVPTLSASDAAQLSSLPAKTETIRRATASKLDELRRLGAPKEDRQTLERYFQALEAQVRQLPSLKAAARRGDSTATRAALGRALTAQKRTGDLARRYGIERCA